MIKNKISISKINKFFLRNKISISEIQKFIKEQKFSLKNKKPKAKNYDKNFYVLSKTFLASLIVISFFSVSPIITKFAKQKVNYSQSTEV